MLECQRLLLRAVSPAPPTREHVNGIHSDTVAILASHSGVRVGGARTSVNPSSWLRWMRSASWEVSETEDQSLVFTLRRSWRFSPEWVVQDAEGRTVGAVIDASQQLFQFSVVLSSTRRRPVERIKGLRVQDASGACLAELKEDGAFARFFTPGGHELGVLALCDGGAELSFAEAVTDKPFDRMLLLAATLIRTPQGVLSSLR